MKQMGSPFSKRTGVLGAMIFQFMVKVKGHHHVSTKPSSAWQLGL